MHPDLLRCSSVTTHQGLLPSRALHIGRLNARNTSLYLCEGALISSQKTQCLGTGSLVTPEVTPYSLGYDYRSRLLYSPHIHTEMFRFYLNQHPAGI